MKRGLKPSAPAVGVGAVATAVAEAGMEEVGVDAVVTGVAAEAVIEATAAIAGTAGKPA